MSSTALTQSVTVEQRPLALTGTLTLLIPKYPSPVVVDFDAQLVADLSDGAKENLAARLARWSNGQVIGFNSSKRVYMLAQFQNGLGIIECQQNLVGRDYHFSFRKSPFEEFRPAGMPLPLAFHQGPTVWVFIERAALERAQQDHGAIHDLATFLGKWSRGEVDVHLGAGGMGQSTFGSAGVTIAYKIVDDEALLLF